MPPPFGRGSNAGAALNLVTRSLAADHVSAIGPR
jgi:hypothetical protein